MTRPHLDASSDSYFGVLAVEGDLRLILTARKSYALQEATPEGWETVEIFPTLVWLHVHLGGVYPCGPVLAAVADLLPGDPSDLTRAQRAALVAECRAIAGGPRSGPLAGVGDPGAVR